MSHTIFICATVQKGVQQTISMVPVSLSVPVPVRCLCLHIGLLVLTVLWIVGKERKKEKGPKTRARGPKKRLPRIHALFAWCFLTRDSIVMPSPIPMGWSSASNTAALAS